MFEPSPQPPPAAPQPPIAPTPPAVEGQAWRLIAQVRGAQRRALWAQGLFFGGAAFLLLVLLAGLVGAAHPTAAQWLLVIAVLAPTALVIGLGVGVSSRRVGDELRTARHLAAKVPELKLDLLAAAELSRALGQRHDFSVGLAQAFIRDVDLRASRLSVRALIDRRPMEWAAAFLALVCIASMGTLAWKGAKVRAGLLAAVSSHATIPPGLKREPITGDIELSYRYPAHTGLEARTVTGTAGDIVGPTGTEVTVHTRADRDVEGAALVVNGKQVPLTTKGRELNGSLLLEKSGQYHFLFLDGSKVVAEGPDLPVQVEADQLPQVRITAPIEVLELDPDKQQVLIKYEVTDDYGVSGLELVHRAAGQEEKRITLKPDEGRTTRGQYTWNLADLRLKPGQAVSYSLEAKDNDAVSGPKKGVSRTQTVKLYSAAEHRREALKKAEALWERLVTHTADTSRATTAPRR